jgi:hypothetical protein
VLLGITIVAYYRLRAKVDKPHDGDDTKRLEDGEPSVIAAYDDNMELPPALTGARCKEILEHFAPIMGVTQGNLLRAAVVLSRAADWADSVAAERAPAGDAQPPSPTKKGGKVLPFSKRKAPRPAEPIEDPPSGRYERIETLADVILLTAHALPTDSPEAAMKAFASLFREDPHADMDTDSGPLWIETIQQFLPGNPRATLVEVNAEYNRRAEEYNRLLDEEERLTPTPVSPVATPHPKTEKP